MFTRRAALTGASALALSSCAGLGAEAPPTPAEQLAALFERVFQERLEASPELATRLGDRRGYDRWDDESEAQDAVMLEHLRRAAAEMREGVDPAQLDASSQLSFRLFEAQAARAEAAWRWRHHGFRFDQMNGAQAQLPAFLINQHQVKDIADAEAYVARLAGYRQKMDQVLERSDLSARLGIMPPRFAYEFVLSDCRNVIAGEPFSAGADSPLWADFKAKVDALQLESGAKARLQGEARAALLASVQPAYETAVAAMTAQQARAGTDDGVWRLPDGAAYYAHQLRNFTTTDMSADAIHDLGLAEVARIHGEMDAIKSAVGFAGDRRAFFAFMATDRRFYVADTAEGRAEYLRRANAAVEAMYARLPQYFGRLPRAPMQVRAVEPFRERSAGLAFYQRPAADGSRPGTYYVNTYDVNAIPTYQIEALAYHEGVPGHHLQIAIAQELENVPSFRRFLVGYAAYSEGWGLYCEGLGKEMGFYQDPYADFGRLTMELRRAIRLVVDTALHHKRWPRQQAVDYVLANQPGDEASATRDINRYIVMPGQATAYKIGQIEILRLREEARAAMGARFDIRGFHDLVLGGGAMPLDILGEQVRAWSAA